MQAYSQPPQTATPAPFEAGVQLYDLPKPAGDRDLVSDVRGMLLDSGVSEDVLAACYDGNRFIKSAQGRNSVVQRVEINRFLQLALINHPDTIDLRAQFLPTSTISSWSDIVEKKVAPFIAENKLLV